jgi:hypothetical protein
MKKRVMCLTPVLIFVACCVGSPDATESDPAPPSVEQSARAPAAADNAAVSVDGVPAFTFGPCAPGSQGTCSGEMLGTVCGSNPTLFCLPAHTSPNGGTVCRCAAQ